MTPLGRIIAGRIAAEGPMGLDDYMRLCLMHPDHGYYATRDPFGAQGDFTTAPEISQMFGELVGLALAQAWLDQGSPAPFTLAELGPGRGTLMADLLRATRRVPGFHDAARVTLVETSPHLRQVQRKRLGEITHLSSVADLPEIPLFLVANEFFDALPIRQMQRAEGGWAERMVTLDDSGALTLALAAPVALPRAAPEGEIWEICAEGTAIMSTVAQRLAVHGGVAIVVDYGTWDGKGDSLQALRRHAPEGILTHPGEADLTAHVDFAPLAGAAIRAGAAASAPERQGDWLRALGIEARAARLAAAGDAGAEAALHRLTDAAEMGHLFKAMAVWPRHLPPPAGFRPLPAAAPTQASATAGQPGLAPRS
ncbi:class I SAM-dependent methyltransferase [Paracoccus sp. MC1862]|uniref:class I SAM-dependent methyltransferase n=1 Tax=Paracoccus sp. MC1862 TaxID=2760307 RepID=UPI00160078A4|nr:SAM-dependent methyltransferase [Paracoccus sp. MC1862]MBB1498220.1 SAM-dependent methyltransferase [Paracoccus sp. MC1862]QQO45711.1 SAM-dependent methyltransferase [Paracoccus sp. MC1862]